MAARRQERRIPPEVVGVRGLLQRVTTPRALTILEEHECLRQQRVNQPALGQPPVPKNAHRRPAGEAGRRPQREEDRAVARVDETLSEKSGVTTRLKEISFESATNASH